MATERTAKVREHYNDDKGRFETHGVCPFCKEKTVALDEDTVEQKCSHYRSMQWGCGGVIFIFEG